MPYLVDRASAITAMSAATDNGQVNLTGEEIDTACQEPAAFHIRSSDQSAEDVCLIVMRNAHTVSSVLEPGTMALLQAIFDERNGKWDEMREGKPHR